MSSLFRGNTRPGGVYPHLASERDVVYCAGVHRGNLVPAAYFQLKHSTSLLPHVSLDVFSSCSSWRSSPSTMKLPSQPAVRRTLDAPIVSGFWALGIHNCGLFVALATSSDDIKIFATSFRDCFPHHCSEETFPQREKDVNDTCSQRSFLSVTFVDMVPFEQCALQRVENARCACTRTETSSFFARAHFFADFVISTHRGLPFSTVPPTGTKARRT